MILDSADESILEAFGVIFPHYQSYDKALDIYYLAVAYLATMRNWGNLAAFQVGRVLFYLRLAGVLAFELTGVRWLLFAFPNAFEPFFVYYEIVRRRGNPLLLTRNAIMVVVAVIWFVLKLPHEWWIHIAKLDATDFIKTHILRASPGTPLWRAIIEAPAVTGSLILIAALLALALWGFVQARKRRVAQTRTATENSKSLFAHWRPPAGNVSMVGDSLDRTRRGVQAAVLRHQAAFGVRPGVLAEKAVLVGVVSVIFGQILSRLQGNSIRTALFVALAVVASDFLLRWVLRRFVILATTWMTISAMALLNFFFVLLFQFILPVSSRRDLASALIFACLITLFVALYDHYRPIHDLRKVEAQNGNSPPRAPEGPTDRTAGTVPAGI